MLTTLRASVIVAGALFSFLTTAAISSTPIDMLDTLAKLSDDTGHGSGTHLGGGRYLTAAHVAEEGRALKVEKRNGDKGTADLVWRDEAYDIAIVLSTVQGPTASISCNAVYVGEKISMAGNPRYPDFVQTWGRVAGGAITDGDTWKVVVPIDITGGPGFSGGPVFDENNQIVGVLVAGYPLSVPVYRGFAFMVPSTAVCKLLEQHK